MPRSNADFGQGRNIVSRVLGAVGMTMKPTFGTKNVTPTAPNISTGDKTPGASLMPLQDRSSNTNRQPNFTQREMGSAAEIRSLREAHTRGVQQSRDAAAAKRASQERERDASMVKPITEPERAHWAHGVRRYNTPGTFEFNDRAL